MLKRFAIAGVVLLFSACSNGLVGPTETPTFTATPIPTKTPVPTETPVPTKTPIPLSSLDVEPILIADGDFPSTFSGEQIEVVDTYDIAGMPEADRYVRRTIKAMNYVADGVVIRLYEEPGDASEAFEVLTTWIDEGDKDERLEPVKDIGEEAYIQMGEAGMMIPYSDMSFKRCNAVVHIGILYPGAAEDVTLNYARRLDARLLELVCR